MSNFNCTCPAIQRGQGSRFLSEGSSWLTACMSEQRRFWRDCADAQARLNLRCLHRRYVPNSLDAVHLMIIQGYILWGGWLGWVMVLGSFQCPGVLLLWHMVGPAVLAAGAGWVWLFFIFVIWSILSSFSNASSLGRWLDKLKYCDLGHYNPTVVVSYYWRRAR